MVILLDYYGKPLFLMGKLTINLPRLIICWWSIFIGPGGSPLHGSAGQQHRLQQFLLGQLPGALATCGSYGDPKRGIEAQHLLLRGCLAKVEKCGKHGNFWRKKQGKLWKNPGKDQIFLFSPPWVKRCWSYINLGLNMDPWTKMKMLDQAGCDRAAVRDIWYVLVSRYFLGRWKKLEMFWTRHVIIKDMTTCLDIVVEGPVVFLRTIYWSYSFVGGRIRGL